VIEMLGYPAIDPWTEYATRVLAPNPGPMTLDGTNTYVVRHPGTPRTVIVDPGPRDPAHLRRVLALGAVELILLTHHHTDHAESAQYLSARTGAPVRAADPHHCTGADPLLHGEHFFAGGVRIEVFSTPGHTADSVCFHIPADDGLEHRGAAGSLLAGDTILGRGTTLISPDGGSLADYLHSISRLSELGPAIVLPGHGFMIDDLNVVATGYLKHRMARLRQIEDAVRELASDTPGEVTVERVTDRVYRDVPRSTRFAAEANVAAQLTYLAERTTLAERIARPRMRRIR
jgi:glyoxylase-like metal-dependent hydrolase (beta-lactamase superfamily II)